MRESWSLMLLAVVLVALPAGGAQAPAVSLDALGWMAGSWSGESGGVAMEEHWLPAKGGLMLGLHRDVANDRAVFFEFLRIELKEGVITYWGSPKGAPATPFQLTELGPRRAVFQNPRHDFPQRITYWLDDSGALHARVDGAEVGRPTSAEWVWRTGSGQ